MAIEEVRGMADEVADLMASRFGGLRRGHTADLTTMLRRRGAALPRKLRKQALLLADADQKVNAPKLARQIDFDQAARAHRALTGHLKPLGQASRWQGGAINITAAVVFGLMLIAAIVIWIMVRRGSL